MFVRELNSYSLSFPNPKFASDEGLLAFGGDLSEARLLSAYRHGIFPWYNEGDPILWWSPNPRMILEFDNFKISKSLNKIIKKGLFEIRFDTAFRDVVTNCASTKRSYTDHTWIQPEIIEAYCRLFELGFAHSFEAFYKNELVGGGYGVVVGDIFCGESMFSKMNNASKVAFVSLVGRLKQNKFRLIDCQVPSEHLQSFGAHTIAREDFLDIIRACLSNSVEF